jgi:hypothetical protein
MAEIYTVGHTLSRCKNLSHIDTASYELNHRTLRPFFRKESVGSSPTPGTKNMNKRSGPAIKPAPTRAM